MGSSRIRKIKSRPEREPEQTADTVFYMSLDEAKAAIMEKYEFLADRYESQYPKHKGIT